MRFFSGHILVVLGTLQVIGAPVGHASEAFPCSQAGLQSKVLYESGAAHVSLNNVSKKKEELAANVLCFDLSTAVITLADLPLLLTNSTPYPLVVDGLKVVASQVMDGPLVILDGSAPIIFRNSSIVAKGQSSGGVGLLVQGTQATVHDVTITGTAYGVVVTGNQNSLHDVSVSRTQFMPGSVGMRFEGKQNISVGNVVSGFDVGVAISGNAQTFTAGTIQGDVQNSGVPFAAGITVSGGGHVVQQNTIAGFHDGIALTVSPKSGNLDVSDNVLHHAVVGVQLVPGGMTSDGSALPKLAQQEFLDVATWYQTASAENPAGESPKAVPVCASAPDGTGTACTAASAVTQLTINAPASWCASGTPHVAVYRKMETDNVPTFVLESQCPLAAGTPAVAATTGRGKPAPVGQTGDCSTTCSLTFDTPAQMDDLVPVWIGPSGAQILALASEQSAVPTTNAPLPTDGVASDDGQQAAAAQAAAQDDSTPIILTPQEVATMTPLESPGLAASSGNMQGTNMGDSPTTTMPMSEPMATSPPASTIPTDEPARLATGHMDGGAGVATMGTPSPVGGCTLLQRER